MIRPLTKLACLALASGALFSPESTITTEVAARRMRMKKLGKMQMQKKSDGPGAGATAGLACVPCLAVGGVLTGFIFLLMWQITVLWGPITSTWDIFFDEPKAPLAAFPDYKLLPFYCQEFQNLELFGPMPSGLQLWQHSMKWMIFLFTPGMLIAKVAEACFGSTDPNSCRSRVGPLVLLAWLGFFNCLWFTNILELDAVNKNEPTCTQWHTGTVPANTTVPQIPVIDTHMRDLSMCVAIMQGLTILPLSWCAIKEALQAFINPEAAQANGEGKMNPLAIVRARNQAEANV